MSGGGGDLPEHGDDLRDDPLRMAQHVVSGGPQHRPAGGAQRVEPRDVLPEGDSVTVVIAVVLDRQPRADVRQVESRHEHAAVVNLVLQGRAGEAAQHQQHAPIFRTSPGSSRVRFVRNRGCPVIRVSRGTLTWTGASSDSTSAPYRKAALAPLIAPPSGSSRPAALHQAVWSMTRSRCT